MSSDPESLLAKYQHDFAAYDSFLQRDSQTPPPHFPRSSKLQQHHTQHHQQRHVDPDATVLDMQHMHDSDSDEQGKRVGEQEEGDGDSPQHPNGEAQTRGGDFNGVSTSGTSMSPAARPPAPHITTTDSAAAVARAIAAHGGLESGRGGVDRASATTRLALQPNALRRRTPADQLDEVDQLIVERLQSAGRYRTTASPDAMYVKSQAWAQRRRHINEALRREQEDKVMLDCTFQPRLGPAAEAETASCHYPPVEDEGPYAAAGMTVTEDPGVAQHLARLETARRQRRESLARLDGGDQSKWTGRPTVPRAFKLGGRVAEPIPSLRKPCVPAPGDVEPWLAGAPKASTSKPRVVFGTVRSAEKTAASPTAAQRKAQSGTRTSTAPAAAAAAGVRRRPNQPSVPPTEGQPPLISTAGEEEEEAKQRRAESAVVDYDRDVELEVPQGGAPASQDLVRRLSTQLADKDAVIQGQMEDLEKLHRELEAVKETLQQIAAMGTVR